VRRVALPVCAALAGCALIVAGCGGSAASAAKHKTRLSKPRHHAVLVSASVIAKAAQLSAAQPGYAVTLSLSVDSSLLGGVASATGRGSFDAQGGELYATLMLPGVLALVSPLSTPVIVTDGTAYVEVPQVLAADLPGVKPWLSVSLTGAGELLGLPATALSGSLTPRTILDALATDSTGKATLTGPKLIDGNATTGYRELVRQFGAGHSVDVWIDAKTGLLSRIAFNSAGHGSASQAGAEVDFTGYGAQSVPAPPPASQVGSLGAALKQAAGV
jgi:hypothetical protein